MKRRNISIRPWLRALHRDAGYLAVGLTLVYALSGIAVNHIADWDPNFQNYEKTIELGAIAGDDATAASDISRRLAIAETPREIYRASPEQLDIVFEHRTLHANPLTGHVIDEGQKPRLILRAANWLHLNRGKRAWTYFADGYAAALLFLAISGMFMIPGRRGILGRGAVLVAVGIALPVLYVTLTGS
jgi:uncharacterized protein